MQHNNHDCTPPFSKTWHRGTQMEIWFTQARLEKRMEIKEN